MDPLTSLASTLLIATPFVTLGYLALCVIWPYRACRHCSGMGRLHGLFGGIRLCRRCDGTGLRLRVGRRVINALRHMYRDIHGDH